MRGITYVSGSSNSKIGSKEAEKMDATYASINASCPNTCSLKDKGCYAQTSFVGIINRRLEKEAKKLTPLQLARAEAKAIDQSYEGKLVPHNRDLRLHVSGDSRTIKGTRLINKAIGRWKKRGGNTVFSYTHAWKHVPRKVWSNVSILASISNVQEAELAKKQGYAAAIVVAEFASPKAFMLTGSNIKWIPCPAQTKHIACVDCRLCFNADRLFNSNFGIAFAAHGVQKNTIKRHLSVLK